MHLPVTQCHYHDTFETPAQLIVLHLRSQCGLKRTFYNVQNNSGYEGNKGVSAQLKAACLLHGETHLFQLKSSQISVKMSSENSLGLNCTSPDGVLLLALHNVLEPQQAWKH